VPTWVTRSHGSARPPPTGVPSQGPITTTWRPCAGVKGRRSATTTAAWSMWWEHLRRQPSSGSPRA